MNGKMKKLKSIHNSKIEGISVAKRAITQVIAVEGNYHVQ